MFNLVQVQGDSSLKHHSISNHHHQAAKVLLDMKFLGSPPQPTTKAKIGLGNLTGYDDAKMTPSFQINSVDRRLFYIEDIHHQQINHQDPQ